MTTSSAIGPDVHPDAWVAPDATVAGAVRIGADSRVASGARLVAEPGATIDIGRRTIVLENAVLRATPRQSLSIGAHCLIGPHAHVVGATVHDEVFVATGASVFHGAVLERGSEVRINAVVHLKSRLRAGDVVPIGWVAIGDPSEVYSPDQHEEIWERQAPLDFPGFVYGIDRDTDHPMQAITTAMAKRLATTPTPTGDDPSDETEE